MCVVLVALAVAAPPGAAGSSQRPKPISAGSAFVLPSTKTCLRGGTITIGVRKPPRVTWSSVAVSVNGKRVKLVKRPQIKRSVRVTGLPNGTIKLSLTARATDGRRVTATRTYRTCAPVVSPSPKPSAPTPLPTPSATPTPTATPTASPTPAPSAPAPGSYAGRSPQHSGYTLSLYVSPDGTRVQDVTVPTFLTCAPNRTVPIDHLDFEDIAIAADGSFAATRTQNGVLAGVPAQFTYRFSGQFNPTNVTGTLRQDVTFTDGSVYSCTTNDQPWSALRTAQGSQAAAAPLPGSYTGPAPQHSGYGLSFYVSPDGKSLQDLTVTTFLACAPDRTLPIDHLDIGDIPIAADGSFTATKTQNGVVSDVPAQFTYTFRGHFHGLSATGVPRVAGMLRETVTFTDGSSYTCTTNDQSWSALRTAQGSQAATAPQPGSYTGPAPQHSGYGLAFRVSADGAHLQGVTVTTFLSCAPTHNLPIDQLSVADIPIAADGSFTSTTTRAGNVAGGFPATFTYTFSGHFHGLNSAGVARVAGMLRQDVTFTDGTAFSCTTNTHSWAALRTGA